MTNNRLDWQLLLPDTAPYEAIFATASQLAPVDFAGTQPRLENGLTLFCHPRSRARFMTLKAQENREYLSRIADVVSSLLPEQTEVIGNRYHIDGNKVTLLAAKSSEDTFAASFTCQYREWIEPEQLFGCVRLFKDQIQLEPGLVHQVNGGVLVLSIRTLIAQPLMWLRLKQMITEGQYHWVSPDETKPLPVTVPPMPLDLRLILVGDRLSLGDLSDMEPELMDSAIYGEFEADLPLTEESDMETWCGYVNTLADELEIPRLAADAWPEFLKIAIRHSTDQGSLTLDPVWINAQLSEAALYNEDELLGAKSLEAAANARAWRESYLQERMQDEIELGQIRIETEGEVVGQINGLSVLEYPGHPRALGEPSRISCVVHTGDGEFTDVERKAELGGNLHAKGMMIMQAFLISELELDQPLPFSASIVFEQSYGEVDGDSASLAELCALISALSMQPINQQIAVTGSVDQFGNVQPIGGVNEKIEGFFEVCQRRGLTGKQGVILPTSNVRNLCLHPQVVDAVREGQFHLWAVDNAAEALPILTGLIYTNEEEAEEERPSLLGLIQQRIALVTSQGGPRYPWPLRWLNWFSRS
ncbi:MULTISPECIES: Lon protease family protein [Rahnella]|uniref:AAA family ATPase n=1 Tax=Rahnella TaxID=34037 RepID=UPI00101B7FCD|nr:MULTISPECIES: Lon protease family protein [Rahnella]RYJ16520.1 Lon protease family protein [Rahnella variigena]TCQ89164.1 Lon-like ATP-dependent protease [Rahnella sp. JUb53]